MSLIYRSPSRNRLNRIWNGIRSPTGLIIVSLLVLFVIGTFLLSLPGMAHDRRLTFDEAAFTTASAISVTGLATIAPGRDLTRLGQVVLLLLIQIGGVGFMVLAVVLTQLLGRKVSLVLRLALSESFGLDQSGSVLKLLQRVLIGVGVIEGTGALFLWLHWRELLGEDAVFYAVFHAVSAFCNAGFDLFGGLAQFPAGIPNDTPTLAILGTLIFLGGLGIPVLGNLLLWPRRRTLTLHTRITLAVVAALVLIGWIGLWVIERRAGGPLSDLPLLRQLAICLFQSVSVRTAGFAAAPVFESLSPASEFLLIALMFIGCAPASMGGGITTGTFAVLVLAVWGYAQGNTTPQIAGRSLTTTVIQRAAAVLTISLMVVCIGTWLILATHDVTFDIALFEVVSAFATCGLTLQFTSELNSFGLGVIMVMMLWGRLGALTIVIALAQQQRSRPLVEYPEEAVLIG